MNNPELPHDVLSEVRPRSLGWFSEPEHLRRIHDKMVEDPTNFFAHTYNMGLLSITARTLLSDRNRIALEDQFNEGLLNRDEYVSKKRALILAFGCGFSLIGSIAIFESQDNNAAAHDDIKMAYLRWMQQPHNQRLDETIRTLHAEGAQQLAYQLFEGDFHASLSDMCFAGYDDKQQLVVLLGGQHPAAESECREGMMAALYFIHQNYVANNTDKDLHDLQSDDLTGDSFA